MKGHYSLDSKMIICIKKKKKGIKTQYDIVETQVSCKISWPCMKLLIMIYELDSNEHYKGTPWQIWR